MSNSIPALFKTSLIAAAVVSLSACSTTPSNEEQGLSRVGAGILTAGRTTADVTSRAWDKTTYLLGFSDDDGETAPGGAVSDEGLLMDAEEVALLEDNAASTRDTTIRPIVIPSAKPGPSVSANSSVSTNPSNSSSSSAARSPIVSPNRKARDQFPSNTQSTPDITTAEISIQTPINNEVGELEQPEKTSGLLTTAESVTTLTESAPATADMVHEVGSSETLWDIAKSTTGDATNWHILADINNLGPNASVYPGQKLTIPADMVKPSLNDTAILEANIQEPVNEEIYVDTQNLAGAIGDEISTTSRQQTTTTSLTESGDAEQQAQVNARAFKLNPGETLWNFAKRTTGDATNWQAIAGQNNFSAEQAAVVRTGQTIYVPEDLIAPELESAVSTAATKLETVASNDSSAQDELLESVEITTNSTPGQPSVASTQGDALRTLTISSKSTSASTTAKTDLLAADEDLLAEKSAPMPVTPDPSIKIVEANFQAEESNSLGEQAADALQSATPDAQSPEQIMVSGTYYPKAIYNNADFSSSLLMRVSPGTTLQVAKALGNWYQVKTSKGLGYVHQRDIK